MNGVQQIRTHVTLHTNGELILWPYGYTKTNVPPDMSTLDHAALVALGRAMAALNGYVAKQSSDLYVTDGDQIDWMYGRHRIFSYTYELFPTEKATVWGDHYPDDSFIAAQTERNREALLHLIDRAACPYADLGSRYVAANCGPLFDDLEINRGWVRNAAGTDTATSGRWAVAQPPAHVVGRGQAAREDGLRGPRPGHRGGRRLRCRRERRGRRHDHDPQPAIRLPQDPAAYGNLTFSWVFAHGAGSSPDDALRVLVEAEDGGQTVVFEVLGRPENVNGSWRTASIPLAGVGRPADPPRDRRDRRGQGQPRRGGGRRRPHPPALTPVPERASPACPGRGGSRDEVAPGRPGRGGSRDEGAPGRPGRAPSGESGRLRETAVELLARLRTRIL